MKTVVLGTASPYIRSLVEAIEGDPEMEVVAQGDNLEELFELSTADQVDLVLIDADAIRPPDHASRNALGYVGGMFPSAHVFVVTSKVNAEAAAGAASRATALIAEGADPEDVLASVRNASTGAVIVQRDIVPLPLAGIGRFPPTVTTEVDEASPLTSRQSEVLELLAQGKHVATIARELGISLHTARGHVKSILAKLGSHSQLEAVVKATSLGWLSSK